MRQKFSKMQAVATSINNFTANTRKAAKSKQTEGYLTTRKTLLQSYWDKYNNLYEELAAGTTSDSSLPEAVEVKAYLDNHEYDNVELSFSESMGEIMDSLALCNKREESNTMNDTSICLPQMTNLPRIKIPTFDGNFKHWFSFKDLFQSVVTSNKSINDTQRLQYLKDALINDAKHVLDNIVTIDSNFQIAWDLLVQKYENQRIIINSYLTQIMNLPKVDTESANQLRLLCDGIIAALRALEQLKRPIEHWDDWLVYIVVHKLDAATRKAWELSLKPSDNVPTFTLLNSFLQNRIQSLEIIQCAIDTPQKPSKSKTTVKGYHTTTSTCPICCEKHIVPHCKTFKGATPEKRKEMAIEHKLCFNCLRQSHRLQACPSEGRCFTCKAKHNSLLHGSYNVVTHRLGPSDSVEGQPDSTTYIVANNTFIGNTTRKAPTSLPSVLLGTAMIEACGPNGQKQILRALLDNGAEATFISEYAAKQLQLPRTSIRVPINGANGTNVACAKAITVITISSLVNDFTMECIAFILPRVGNTTPGRHIPHTECQEFNTLALADPRWNQPGSIDIILSAADYALILRDEVKRNLNNTTVAQNTALGWVIFGGLCGRPLRTHLTATQCYNTQIDLNHTLRKFWEIEELNDDQPLTNDEVYCETLFETTTKRTISGRYVVRLPIKDDVDLHNLATSKIDALALLKQTHRRLNRDPVIKKFYNDFMAEYHNSGHMEVTTESDQHFCYLPHHGVWKDSSTTTKLRVVFNASRRYATGVSLNDCLHVGPKLQHDLANILLNWRMYKISFTGDVEKMYRQILVDHNDANLQRIFWCQNPEDTPISYTLSTVTYGTNCAPYLALKVLRKLANDERGNFPRASKSLEAEFYIDDVLSGADTCEEALQKIKELKSLLQAGGFTLRKFNSNSNTVLNALDMNDREASDSFELNWDGQTKALGTVWLTRSDSLAFNINLDYNTTNFNKRQLASDVARIFDPLGLLSPVTVRGKIFLQQLWDKRIEWDEALPHHLQHEWNLYRNELRELEQLRIPRWLAVSTNSVCVLHAFSDASKTAYAAAVYLVVTNADSSAVNLLMAKTKVAPLKKSTIPRLELCGALLAAQLLSKVKDALSLHSVRCFLWTDSITALCWIRTSPGRLNQFVANRVTRIQAVTNSNDWRYISTNENPADAPSKGISVRQLLKQTLWWTGPSWLLLEEECWPRHTINFVEDIPECKNLNVCTVQLESENRVLALMNEYSNLDKLLVTFAWWLRFINKCCKKTTEANQFCTWPERYAALTLLVKITQRLEFGEEMAALQQNRDISKRSKLRKLNPIIDNEGIMRLRGRLLNANIPFNEKCPMILPKRHILTSLIVRHAHQRTMHGGTQSTLGYTRRQFWIIDGRTEVKRVVHDCVICFRHDCVAQTQLMGNLPPARCNIAFPFLHTGVDYAGPFNVRTSKGRGHKSQKGYVALFICFATRAIHLELVSDMTTPTFLLALDRFVSTRGICSDLYSDQGTTFVGADTFMKNELTAFRDQLKAAANYSSTRGINWHFIPPGAPNFGGLWEAGVKSVKDRLKRTINTATLTFEEFYTVLKRVEACLNSRPLAALNDDPTDLAVVTPGHILIGRAITSVPEPNLLDTKVGILCRWKQLSQMHQDFWRNWSTTYLHQLQVRTKWQRQRRNVKVGELVLIRDDRAPPTQWLMGRITETHPGTDGVVRVVTIRTATTTLKRPISKISVLPIVTDIPNLINIKQQTSQALD